MWRTRKRFTESSLKKHEKNTQNERNLIRKLFNSKPNGLLFRRGGEGVNKMTDAKKGDTVKVHYTGKLDDGSVFDTSREGEPLEFIIGEGHVIPGFEDAVVGMSQGEKKTVRIESKEAYGPHYDEGIIVVDRANFPDDLKPKLGDVLQIPQQDGDPLIVTITEITDTKITLDANHPLAGKDLTFDIELVEIL